MTPQIEPALITLPTGEDSKALVVNFLAFCVNPVKKRAEMAKGDYAHYTEYAWAIVHTRTGAVIKYGQAPSLLEGLFTWWLLANEVGWDWGPEEPNPDQRDRVARAEAIQHAFDQTRSAWHRPMPSAGTVQGPYATRAARDRAAQERYKESKAQWAKRNARVTGVEP